MGAHGAGVCVCVCGCWVAGLRAHVSLPPQGPESITTQGDALWATWVGAEGWGSQMSRMPHSIPWPVPTSP